MLLSLNRKWIDCISMEITAQKQDEKLDALFENIVTDSEKKEESGRSGKNRKAEEAKNGSNEKAVKAAKRGITKSGRGLKPKKTRRKKKSRTEEGAAERANRENHYDEYGK